MLTEIYKYLDERYDFLVKTRRYLHQHPELSFQETETAMFIARFYQELEIDVRTGVGGNGVVARIQGAKPGKTVALRADFDALPIQDEKTVPYRSKVPGVMHACGHDGHTAILLGVASALHAFRDQLAGEYVLIHQHAEEVAPGGAKSMIADGCLDGVDAIFGTHLWSLDPLGQIGYRSGPIMASPDVFEVTITGKGGHGAEPHLAKDPIVAASQFVTQLQQIVSRRIDPLEAAVVSIGEFHAGNAFNVIAEEVKLAGTVRTFKEEVRDTIKTEMEKILKGIATSHDCTYTFDYTGGYPALVNHKEETEFLAKIARDVPGVTRTTEIAPRMVGEDFAYYLQHVKGTFFFTGARPENAPVYPHHHPKFDFNEKAMLIAAKTLIASAIRYQEWKKQCAAKTKTQAG